MSISTIVGVASDGRGDAPPPTEACAEVSAEAHYDVGYNHWIRIVNACTTHLSCDAWTDVNPERQNVQLEPGQRADVLTFRGSPASVFYPVVVCSAVPR
ncbi:MAG TPA: hypothetical protein VJT73_05680 [Polyangiaceae bacterium]|nr:hypothetical protein [Polyangiaceae bacterium]